MQKLLLLIFAIVMAYGIAGCATKDAGAKEPESIREKEASKAEVSRFEFPKEYKNWTHATSKIILDKSSPLYRFQQVFVNDVALDAYKRGNGYPEGSMILIGFYEADVEGDSIIPEKITTIFFLNTFHNDLTYLRSMQGMQREKPEEV